MPTADPRARVRALRKLTGDCQLRCRRPGQRRATGALETGAHPTATFTLTDPVELDTLPTADEPVEVTAHGELTINGVTNAVEVPLEGAVVDGVMRRDITTGFGGASGTAEGVPLAITMNLVDDDGCYAGRWPHIHFEVYPDLAAATEGNRISTSQIALPEGACTQVYATAGYEQSVTNLAQVSLDGDMVFGDDGGERQLGTVTGSIDDGLAVTLDVRVSAA